MLYARDRHGNRVRADEVSRSRSYGLRCLECSAPVILRKGKVFRAHFAHKAKEAQENCQYYHKGYDHYGFDIHPPDTHRAKDRYISSNLYCRGGFDSDFELSLLLPKGSGFPIWSGRIVISGKWGNNERSWTQLHRSTYIPIRLRPSLHPLIQFVGDVNESYKNILLSVGGLEEPVNCFNFSDNYGRRLGQGEELYWGDKYWVITRHSYAKPPYPITIIKEDSEKDYNIEWSIYLVELPSAEIALGTQSETRIGDWIKHAVKTPESDITILSPLPIRLGSDDGAYIVSEDCSSAVLSVPDATRLVVLDEQSNEMQLTCLKDDLVTVPFETDEVRIYYNGKPKSIFRREPINHFNPRGIEVVVNAEAQPMFAATKIILGDRIEDTTVDIQLPDRKVGKAIKINSVDYEELSKPLIDYLSDLQSLLINGDNFGEVSIIVKDRTKAIAEIESQYTELIKLLFCLASTDHDRAICLPENLMTSNTPSWLRRLHNMRWGSEHAHYVKRLITALKGATE